MKFIHQGIIFFISFYSECDLESRPEFEETRIAYEEEKAKEGTLENATAIKKEVVTIINDKLVFTCVP